MFVVSVNFQRKFQSAYQETSAGTSDFNDPGKIYSLFISSNDEHSK